MTTQDRIDQAKRIQQAVNFPSGFFSRRVVKKDWPTGWGEKISTLTWEQGTGGPKPPLSFGQRIREYRLQHTALESFGVSNDDVDAFIAGIDYVWEHKFQTDLARLTESRLRVTEGNWLLTGSKMTRLDLIPRWSLFGRFVRPYKAAGVKRVINKKYSRCPRQVLSFHPGAVHFLFTDLENWAGKIIYAETDFGDASTGYFRCVMSVAAKPMLTHQGCVITVFPKGLRGQLYKLVWALLRIKP